MKMAADIGVLMLGQWRWWHFNLNKRYVYNKFHHLTAVIIIQGFAFLSKWNEKFVLLKILGYIFTSRLKLFVNYHHRIIQISVSCFSQLATYRKQNDIMLTPYSFKYLSTMVNNKIYLRLASYKRPSSVDLTTKAGRGSATFCSKRTNTI